MTNDDRRVEVLNDKLSALENESMRILNALQWATKVRMILFFGLLLFALISAFLFYRLYIDIKDERIAKVQQIIAEKPAEFSEPLTRQVMSLAEEQGPFVMDVFRKQAQQDSELYLNALDTERETLINNLQKSVEVKLAASYTKLLDEQEALLVREFPELKDPRKMENVRRNLEMVYQKVGNRYYANYLKEELDELSNRLDTFPPTEPKQYGVPVAEQIAGESLELVRMMLIASENYQAPEANTVSLDKPTAPDNVETPDRENGTPDPGEEDEKKPDDDSEEDAN
jgi:hypothetical protein